MCHFFLVLLRFLLSIGELASTLYSSEWYFLAFKLTFVIFDQNILLLEIDGGGIAMNEGT